MTDSAFKRWSDFLGNEEIEDTPTTNRFIARFRLASKFTGINADGYSEKTLRAYNSLMSVFLSHTAFESFTEAIAENERREDKKLLLNFKVDLHNHPFEDLQLAEDIRSNEKLMKIIINYADISRTTVQMEALMSFYGGVIGGTHLNAVAKQIRHLVAHGHMTAYGSDAVDTDNGKAFFSLAELIRNETYALFDQYVSKLEAKFSNMRLGVKF